MTGTSASDAGFRHEALFYSDAEEYLAGTVPFVREGIGAGEAVMVAAPKPNLELLGNSLDGAGENVVFVEMEELGRNPARIISAWWDFLEARDADGRRARGIGEPTWAGRSAAELEECGRHESLLNLAFADSQSWSLLCPYDTTSLSDEVLTGAEHSHPHVSGRRRSAAYAEPPDVTALLGGELEPPSETPARLSFGEDELHEVRGLVAERGQRAGLEVWRLEDLVLAANEIATNSLRYGGGRGEVRIWQGAGALVCDFRDSGRFEEPLVGRRRPDASQLGGRGLWIANQLCDLVQIRRNGAGSLVRLQMALGDGEAGHARRVSA